jgi:GTP pyrophosphokinase
MVRSSTRQLPATASDVDAQLLGSLLNADSDPGDLERLEQALQLLRHSLREAESAPRDAQALLTDSFQVAAILADLQLDLESLLAGMLHPAVQRGVLSLPTVRNHFGEAVANLIEGVQRMDAVSSTVTLSDGGSGFERQHRQQDLVRRMLVAVISDVRVALIKIAERAQALRAVKKRPERQRAVASEVFDIYAPLAHRLGIGQLKWELEDLAFRYLYPEDYRRIAALLDERRLTRQEYIDGVTDVLHRALGEAGLDCDVQGRAKHIYSIWRKMTRKGISFSEVYDVRALRILVDSVRDCYTALGVVHGLWRNIPQEFDDYIAIPKANGYRSLHTAVYGPEGKVVEVQIRTREMHRDSELGVCSHWRYKGTDAAKEARAYEEKVAWLRQVLDWHETLSGGSTRRYDWDAGQDRVYVFTPDGHVVDLPTGATPIDFAYTIHTDIGHRCHGAKVDGRIVPLSYKLQTGERIEILTGRRSAPSRDWLRHDLGFVSTARARSKIQHWFRRQAREDNLQAGRQLLEREFRRLALDRVDLEALTRRLGMQTMDEVYVGLGAGELGTERVLNALQALLAPPPPAPRRKRAPRKPDQLTISGVGNLMTHLAGCCKPVPGDAIAGYVTIGRGVSVHRQDCSRLLQLQEREPERVVVVEWGEDPGQLYPVDILIEAYDRAGLLRDITTLLANERINVLRANTEVNRRRGVAVTRVTAEVASLELLGRVLSKINQLPNVIQVRRIAEDQSHERT